MSAVESGSVPMEMIASAPAQMGLREIGDWAARMERIGFEVIHISETIHDPFTIAAGMPVLMTTTAVTAAPAGSRRFILGLRTPRRTFRASYPQSPVDQPSGGPRRPWSSWSRAGRSTCSGRQVRR
jgi:hypothetical protein